MTIELKQVLATMKKTYPFVIKIASNTPVTNEQFKGFDTIMGVKGMIKRSKPNALPLAAAPTDFIRLKGFYGTIYRMEIEFEYPITENQIKNELCTFLNLDRAFIIVRTANSPLEEIDDNYLDYKDEDYVPVLLNDKHDDINPNDYYGDEYNKELVKKLQSAEAKKYQQHFDGVAPEILKAMTQEKK